MRPATREQLQQLVNCYRQRRQARWPPADQRLFLLVWQMRSRRMQ